MQAIFFGFGAMPQSLSGFPANGFAEHVPRRAGRVAQLLQSQMNSMAANTQSMASSKQLSTSHHLNCAGPYV
jgi:hypothetical protein